jgi:ketosteroid isomerase-like protein
MTLGEFMQRYEAVNAAQDLPELLKLIADDAIYLFSNGSAHLGKAAVAAAIGKNYETIKGDDYHLADLRWLAVSDEVASCVYTFHWAGEIGGQRMSGRGRGSTVLRKDGDGWKVALEHLSAGGL